MINQIVHQPRTAIVEAVKVVLKRAQGERCSECTLGMLLDELSFQEHEFVAAGIGLSCIYATKTTIDWNALMTAIEVKRYGSLPIDDIFTKSPQERQHWLNEALKLQTGRSKDGRYRW